MADSSIPLKLDAILYAVLALTKSFVERQTFVYEVIHALCPHWVMLFDGTCMEMKQEDWQRFFMQYHQMPGKGFWGNDNEWAYNLRGFGCTLRHRFTGEILVWNLNLRDLNQFDMYDFVDHVRWLMTRDNNPHIATIKSYLSGDEPKELETLLFQSLDQLATFDLIQRGTFFTRYVLHRT